MWSPVLTTGWHKQVLFTNQWAAQVHTVWLQPKILWDCKFSFLHHFLFSITSRLIPFWPQTWFSVQWRELAWHESHFRLSGRGTSRWLIILISYASWAMSVPNVKSRSPTIRWQKQKKLRQPHFRSRSRESMWSPFLLLAFVFSALVNAAPKEVFIGPEKLIEEESAATTCQTAILRFLS